MRNIQEGQEKVAEIKENEIKKGHKNKNEKENKAMLSKISCCVVYLPSFDFCHH